MATALELKHEGWQHLLRAESIKKTASRSSAATLKEREELLIRLRKAAALVKSKFLVRRVILIGSLAHASWFTPDSDVDIVVEGLSSRFYWGAWKVFEDEIGDRPVDLIDIETASEPLKRAINRIGIEL